MLNEQSEPTKVLKAGSDRLWSRLHLAKICVLKQNVRIKMKRQKMNAVNSIYISMRPNIFTPSIFMYATNQVMSKSKKYCIQVSESWYFFPTAVKTFSVLSLCPSQTFFKSHKAYCGDVDTSQQRSEGT